MPPPHSELCPTHSRSFYHFIISSQMLIWSISCLSVSQSLEVISVLWLLKYKVSLLHFHHFNTSSIVSTLFLLPTSTIGHFQVHHLITLYVSDTLNSSSLCWYWLILRTVKIFCAKRSTSEEFFYMKTGFREPLSFLNLFIQPFHFSLIWNIVKLHKSEFPFYNCINTVW